MVAEFLRFSSDTCTKLYMHTELYLLPCPLRFEIIWERSFYVLVVIFAQSYICIRNFIYCSTIIRWPRFKVLVVVFIVSYIFIRNFNYWLITLTKVSRSTTVFPPLPARLLTHSPSSRVFWFRRRCAKPARFRLTHFVFRTNKCRSFHSIVSL